jgi:hypothetical protein
MYNPCPKCKSKNIKCIKTIIGEITCKCLDCGEEFKIKPPKELEKEFNG